MDKSIKQICNPGFYVILVLEIRNLYGVADQFACENFIINSFHPVISKTIQLKQNPSSRNCLNPEWLQLNNGQRSV